MRLGSQMRPRLLPNKPQACRYWQQAGESADLRRQQATLFAQGRQWHFCRKPLKYRAFCPITMTVSACNFTNNLYRIFLYRTFSSELVRAARSILKKRILLLTVASGQRVKFGSKAGFAAMY
jgi:hypothetical protein